jgi:hypothetical protein
VTPTASDLRHDPGEPVPGNILDTARALQAAGFSSRAIGGITV